MAGRRCFRPSDPLPLEDRTLLSHGPLSTPVTAGGLYPYTRTISYKLQTTIALVNQAFDSFQNDYGQARGTYDASILNQSNPSSVTTNAFMLYTTQRVNVLAQQIISAALASPQGVVRTNGMPNTLSVLIKKQIITQNELANPTAAFRSGTLEASLINSIPPAGASAPSASLYALTQNNAIEAARVAVINGVSIMRIGSFGNTTKSH